MELDRTSKVERVLESQELLWGPNSVEVANTLLKLSQLYWIQGHYAEAEVCLARALDSKLQLYGPNNPEVLHLLETIVARSNEQARRAEDGLLGRCYQRDAQKGGNTECGGTPAAGAFEVSFGNYPESTQKSAQQPANMVSFLITESSGERFELPQGSIFIGRDKMNDISLPDDSMAEKSQAMIKKEGDDYWITNQAKASPTMLNSKPVLNKTKLRCGDILTVGVTTIRIG